MSRGVAARPISRNEPCPCGSGKKYKQCCLVTGGTAGAQRTLPRALTVEDLLRQGLECHQRGEIERAMSSYELALRRQPDNADALHLMGAALAHERQFETAIPLICRAIELNENAPGYHQSLATALEEMGDLPAAVGCLRAAACRFPGEAFLHQALGEKLDLWEDWQGAIAEYRTVLQINPSSAAAHRGLAIAFAKQSKDEQALAEFALAAALDKTDVVLYSSYADCLMHAGRLPEALVAYKHAEALQAESVPAGQYTSVVRQKLCDWHGIEEIWAELRASIAERRKLPLQPLAFLSLPSSAAEQLACARNWCEQFAGTVAGSTAQTAGNARKKRGHRLRIGYVSSDLRNHAVGQLVAELFERHDRDRFAITAYSTGPDDHSTTRARIAQSAGRFVDLEGVSSAAAAQRIQDDEIDILVDLNGHTYLGRPGVMALHPASIQVNYLGYASTYGATFMDYIVVDPFVVPPDQAQHFAERLAYMPDCYLPYSRTRRIAELTPSRLSCGLPESGFVFCCLNQPYKITPTVFAVWMRLLAETPGSVLWLAATNQWAIANLLREAQDAGIDPERLVFAGKLPEAEYLARYQVADLFLDTLPYNGHSIVADALWAGLPVLTCSGDTFASRVAGSLLHAAGLPELVTTSLREYEAVALKLAQDAPYITALRHRLTTNRGSAPLFDCDRYTRNLEALYDRMWDEYGRVEPGVPVDRWPLVA